MVSGVLQYKAQLLAIVEENADGTLAEYCELLLDELFQAQCTGSFKASTYSGDKTLHVSQAASERVQLLRQHCWAQVTGVKLENLMFLDEMGILLELTRPHDRAAPGRRAYDFKPFSRGAKVSVTGAISIYKVLAMMTINDSMNSADLEIYVSQYLVPELWPGTFVARDNLPAHKVKVIEPLIEAAGAKILWMSPYSPEFNPIEHWWPPVKAMLIKCAPTTAFAVVGAHFIKTGSNTAAIAPRCMKTALYCTYILVITL